MFFSLCRFTLTLFPLCFGVHVFHRVVLAIEENYKTIKSIQATFIGVHRSWVSAFVFFFFGTKSRASIQSFCASAEEQ